MLVSLVLADDEEVHELNKQWRAKDKPTNVLSFMLSLRKSCRRRGSRCPGHARRPHPGPRRLRTRGGGKSVTQDAHTSHLIVHGLLHLAGYDHETGEADAEEMEGLERKALALLGIADPYA
jgi:probable rRNA maturation factor